MPHAIIKINIPGCPRVLIHITGGIHTTEGPICIITRKKTIAESPGAKLIPAIVSPIHEIIAAINAVPITPIETPFIDKAVASSKSSPDFSPNKCCKVDLIGLKILFSFIRNKDEVIIPTITWKIVPNKPSPLVMTC